MNKIKLILSLSILIFIVFLILYIIPKNIKQNFTDLDLYNGDKWNNYRIGDVYNCDKNLYDKNYKHNILFHIDKFPNSIAAEYMEKNKNMIPRNLKLLNHIIKNKHNLKTFKNNEIVIHIRVGDVMCVQMSHTKGVSNTEMLYTKKGNVLWWNKVLNYIKKNNIKKVYILSGTHVPNCLSESLDYVNDRKYFFEKNGINTELRLGHDPDNDILFCKNAKHFITTWGGYGVLLGNIVKSNGGNFVLYEN